MARKPKPAPVPAPAEPPKRKHRATGRPRHRQAPFVASPELRKKVFEFFAVGTTQEDVARVLGIGLNTVKRHFTEEFKRAAPEANATVKANLFRMTKTNVASAIFWLINRDSDNWKQRQDVAVKGTISLEQAVTNAIARANGGKK